MAVFSDTSGKTGLIQICEEWTGLGDGGISGDSTLLAQFTAKLNAAFDEILPLVLSRTNKGRWDDLNNTDYPIATLNIVSGQNDYSILQDQDSLDILQIFDVRILTSSSSTEYQTLESISLNDERALKTMSPNPSEIGIPDRWLGRDNTIFLGDNPNYSATNGMKIYFERVQQYFLSSDTTKKPGIPRQFHTLLAYIASYDWLTINKPLSITTQNNLQQKIAQKKRDLSDSEDARNNMVVRIGVNTNPIPGSLGAHDSNR